MTTLKASREWRLPDAEATRAAGGAIARELLSVDEAAPLVITLQGDLGAGKTTLVSGLLNALGHPGAARSPTYTLIEPYDLNERQFYHLDLYRLTDPLQLEEIGVRDLLQPRTVLLVEWPERAPALVSGAGLQVHLAYPTDASEGRLLRIDVTQESLSQLLHRLTF